ncbi:MAG: RnfABCDGE type electron transport complex subunit G [Alistipes sp.]|nr:RnfABCDGE type electron transport complex subunit G [Alistipes sp.]
MKSTLKNMILTLLVITLIASAAVGLVYQVTAGPIAQAKQEKVTTAIAAVLPAFDNQPGETRTEYPVDGGTLTLYTATQGADTVGYAIETFTMKGFGGEIRLMVGFLKDGTIHSVETLSHNETPGLGNKIERSKSDFSVQFEGKNPADFKLSVRKDGGDVDAITASTISSRAYTDAVNRAYTLLQSLNSQNHE